MAGIEKLIAGATRASLFFSYIESRQDAGEYRVLNIAIRTIVAVYIAYLALVTLIVIPAANFLAPWFVDREYGRALHTDIILFNPFSLSA